MIMSNVLKGIHDRYEILTNRHIYTVLIMKQMHTQLFYISFEAVKAKRFYVLLNKEADKILTFPICNFHNVLIS